MAKYTIECPKCGSITTPPSALKFWQKDIKCVTCGEVFNIKQSRMISKICSKCGKVVVCDQKKLNESSCPSCGNSLSNSAKADYVGVKIQCPQCYCKIEIDKTTETQECPICEAKINVKEILTKAEQVSASGISVIKYEGDNDTFVWKHPIEDFNLGSQLIVHESQEAIFFLGGEALDKFRGGTYTLSTENLPVLSKMYALPTDNANPFHAEVYFINKTVQMALNWGTKDPARFRDPQYGLFFDIGASGNMSLQVSDSRKLLVKLVGTTQGISWDINQNDTTGKKTLKQYFTPTIASVAKDYLATVMTRGEANIFELDACTNELSEGLRERLSEKFEVYGLTVTELFITGFRLPENNSDFTRLRKTITETAIVDRESGAAIAIENANRSVELEKGNTKIAMAMQQAEIRNIEAQTAADVARKEAEIEAERIRMMGIAGADVMSAEGVTRKDLLEAEVQKAFAESLGQMGSGGSTEGTTGGGNGMFKDMIQFKMGMAAFDTMSDKMDSAFSGFSNDKKTNMEPMKSTPAGLWKCSCGCDDNKGKYCSECGKTKPEEWICPSCGAVNEKGKFCSECGTGKPELWTCPSCGAKENKGKFCSECGALKGGNSNE